MSLTTVTKSKLTNLANAVRSKIGSSDLMTLDEMVTNIQNIDTDQLNPYFLNTLTSVTIAEGVTIIPSSFFSGKSSLTSASLPSTLEEIRASSFAGTGLTRLICPSASLYIAPTAFNGTRLTEISISPNITQLQIGSGVFEDITTLTTLTINSPSFATISIGEEAFKGCTGLTTISLGPGLVSLQGTSFGGYNFKNCSNLSTINTSGSTFDVTSIPKGCFEDCNKLPSLTFGEYTSGIYDAAFHNAASQGNFTTSNPWVLRFKGQGLITIGGTNTFNTTAPLEIHFEQITPPTLGSGTNTFNTTTLQKIVVPYSADHSVLNNYQSASNWSNYSSFMVEAQS